MNITKKDISFRISKDLNINKDISLSIFDFFINTIKIEAEKKSVKINKFGTFTKRNTKERKGRNPKTLEEYKISSIKKLNFKASSKIKTLLN